LPDLRGTCSLEVTVDADEDGVLSIEPDRLNPNTWRDFCRKGKTAAEGVEHPRRVLTPIRRVDDRNEAATYEDAIGDIADRLNRIMARRVVVPLFVPPTKSASPRHPAPRSHRAAVSHSKSPSGRQVGRRRTHAVGLARARLYTDV
jgi:anaerobic selenocysteine-containing dehydrogenase